MLKLQNIKKVFSTEEIETWALRNVNIEVNEGEFVAIMGPSGCGKSTLLNILGLLDNPTSGTYLLNGVDVSKKSESERTDIRKGVLGFVFQSFNLIEDLNVTENIELPLLYMGLPAKERKLRVEEAMKRMDISHRSKHYPAQLSGGQQQRVAIARALVKMPRVLLLDEPLSNLDARLRLQTREEIRRIQRETKITTVFVTHDQEEAMSISDEIVVMKLGVVQQKGAPQHVYDDPANLFVAKFLGTPPINVFSGNVKDGFLFIGEDKIMPVGSVADQDVYVGIRPEGFILREDGKGALNNNFTSVETMGGSMSVVSTNDHSENAVVRSTISTECNIAPDAKTVSFDIKPNKIFIFNKETEERIYFEVK